MKSTMQDSPLLISGIIRHGEYVFADKKIFTVTPDGVNEATFFQVSKRAEQLAAALTALGVRPGDRVGTFMWNNQAHVEAYLAVPSTRSTSDSSPNSWPTSSITPRTR
jgi:fatty-acyl-CoA synthase